MADDDFPKPEVPSDFAPIQFPGRHVELSEPPPAASRLRAFEDKHLGKDASRIMGQIERGHGSPFQLMHRNKPELAKHHAALERLVKAEHALSEANAALSAARIEHEAASKAVEGHAEHDE